jgi:hypothetical protein
LGFLNDYGSFAPASLCVSEWTIVVGFAGFDGASSWCSDVLAKRGRLLARIPDPWEFLFCFIAVATPD